MKILFLIRSLNYGGAERQLVELARGLKQRGHTVGVAVFYPGGVLEADLRAENVSVYSLEKQGTWDVVGFMYRAIRLARTIRPDVLHGYLPIPNLLSSMIRGFLPSSVTVVWGIRSAFVPPTDQTWLSRLSYWAESRLANWANLIIVNSSAGKRDGLSRGIPDELMVVIHNGVDTERFRPDEHSRRRIRKEWGVNDDEMLIGIVGRLDPLKGHESFIRAAARLRPSYPCARFVVVGDGPASYTTKIRKLAECLEVERSFLWAGYRGDMPSVYNALDILVSSSITEGCSNVIGEAMACGVVCVATDTGDSAIIVGKRGFVVGEGGEESLAACLEKALLDKAGISTVSVRERILSLFSLGHLIDRVEVLLANHVRKAL